MTIECNVHFVLLPKLLQAILSHRLPKWAILPIRGGITKNTMGCKDQPWLFLPISWCKTFLYKFVLFRSLPPIMFTVSYTEVEHAIIRWIPVEIDKLLFVPKAKICKKLWIESFNHYSNTPLMCGSRLPLNKYCPTCGVFWPFIGGRA